MVKGSFTKRFVRPAAEVLIVMAVSFIVYNISWRIENRFLHDGLAYVFGVIYFSSLAFGTLYVYRQAFFRGAGPAERMPPKRANQMHDRKDRNTPRRVAC